MALRKIDVHHHVYPGEFYRAIEKAGGDPSGWSVPDWTLEADRAINAANGTGTTILSVTAPGPTIEPDAAKAAALARECNIFCAKLRDNHPDEYGFFASVPSLLQTDAALKEISYAFDALNADGIILMTRYGNDNHYLGHPDFQKIWEELNRRKVVVFVHPTHPVDTRLVNGHLPEPMFDYPQETGRAAMDLIVNDNLNKYPDCKIILSHAGGTLPYLIYRAAGMLPYTPMSCGKSTEELIADARKFYFDTALSADAAVLDALLALAEPQHVLFGSDFPNAPKESIRNFTKKLETFVTGREIEADIFCNAALILFPRLRRFYA